MTAPGGGGIRDSNLYTFRPIEIALLRRFTPVGAIRRIVPAQKPTGGTARGSRQRPTNGHRPKRLTSSHRWIVTREPHSSVPQSALMCDALPPVQACTTLQLSRCTGDGPSLSRA